MAIELSGWWSDLRAAAAFLTRVPVSGAPVPDIARAMRAFPLVGAAIGLAGGAVYAFAYGLGLPTLASALLALAASALVTGALHEDGLADMADGLAGGHTPERRLEIMDDSRIGTAGAIALIMSFALRAAALSTLASPGLATTALIAAGAGSRAVFPPLLLRLAPARAGGLGAGAGLPSGETAVVAAGLGGLIVLICLGGSGIAAVVAAGLAAAAVGMAAQHAIGGHTGDVMGAAQQAAECAILLTAAAALGVA